MKGLRARLLLVTVLVAAVAVVVSALFSRQVVDSEFRRFIGVRPVDLAAVTHDLEAALAAPRESGTADEVIARHARRLGRALLLFDPSGAVLATSSASLRGVHVMTGEDGRFQIEAPGRDGASPGVKLELRDPPSAPVHDAAGRTIGTLIVLPEARPPEARSGSFLSGVNRGLWLGALVAILVGALLMSLLASRVVGPIEALTAAAGRLESGDLSVRVQAAGSDEVAVLTRRFNAMAESLERATALRRQLTYDVAHELRTPLTSLRGQIEALEDGLLEPTAANLRSLREEVALLAGLVADLEQLAAAESGALQLDLADVDVDAALRAAVAAFSARALEQGLALTVEGEAGLHARADERRLAQVLRNLVANALEHTPAGGRVSLAARRDGASVAFEVADTGEGIAPEHLPHVFDRFYRADPSRARATGGAGLGLAIVRSLVRAQGGAVRAESETGRGTRMVFTLPAA